MSDQASPPRRTAVIGGVLLIACAVAWAVGDFHLGLQATVPYMDLAVAYAGALLLLAAMIVLAVGVRGETGVFGTSRLVVSAAIIFGARNAAFQAQGDAATRLPATTLFALSNVLIVVTLVLTAVFAVAIVVVAIAQTRSGRGGQFELTALWSVVGAEALLTLVSFVDSAPVAFFVARTHAELLLPLGLALLGVAYLVRGFRSGVAAATYALDRSLL